MSSANDEEVPLLATQQPSRTATASSSALSQSPKHHKSHRNVSFNPIAVTRTFDSSNSSTPSTSRQHSLHSTNSPGRLASTINNKLLRRHSQSSVPILPPAAGSAGSASKIGPQRTTKNVQKLKLLPTPEVGKDGPDEESGRDVYAQYTRIEDPNARRDAARLGKADRLRLPRVTAYCTANKYEMTGLMRHLRHKKHRGAQPKLIDECIYTPFDYASSHHNEQLPTMATSPSAFTPLTPEGDHPDFDARPQLSDDPISSYERRHSTGSETNNLHQLRQSIRDQQKRQAESDSINHPYQNDVSPDASRDSYQHLLDQPIQDVEDGRGSQSTTTNYVDDSSSASQLTTTSSAIVDETGDDVNQPVNVDVSVHTPEVFLFDYGVVVIWGMTEEEEERFLKEISKFEIEKLAPDDVETEFFNFYYTSKYQARIYNDFIALRDKHNYMTKLAISHALAQSVQTSLFEGIIASTIEQCKDIPVQIALTGKIKLTPQEINMQIGDLFILRISIHLNGSVLDTPELFWLEPQLEPVYQAVRSYLEIDQRVGLLSSKLDVIADLLAVLKEQLSHGHEEKLEWIVIILIAMEILVAAINIVVDLVYAVD